MPQRREEPALSTRRSSSLRERRRSRPRLEELESRNLLSVLAPAQIRQAYGFNQLPYTGAGQTIAIVDAYSDPTIANDLQVFDQQFGLANASLTVATPQGQPAVNAGWAGETALDVEWAHAIAPGANILLVEAKSDSLNDLTGAVQYAEAQKGVSVVSMSWGTTEFAGETAYDSLFTTPGVTFVASAGDNGAWYGADWPASSPNVLSVGGTTLMVSNTGAYAGETAWSSYSPWQYGSGGGVSSFESEPAYQAGVQASGGRTTPDVAYDANPNTGFYVYDSNNGGWLAAGGTSAGAPQWAGLVALADQGRAQQGEAPLSGSSQTLPALYALAQTSYGTYYNDITSGSNGYRAGPGYDLVTGLGSPKANTLVPALVTVNGSGTNLTVNGTTTTTGTTTTPTKTRRVAHHHDTATATQPPGDGSSTSGSGTTTQSGQGGTSTTSARTTASLAVPLFVSTTPAATTPGTGVAAVQVPAASASVNVPPAGPGTAARGAALDLLSGGGAAAAPLAAEAQGQAPTDLHLAPDTPVPNAAGPATAIVRLQARDAYFAGVATPLLSQYTGPGLLPAESVGVVAQPLAGVGLALLAGGYWAEATAGEGAVEEESRRGQAIG